MLRVKLKTKYKLRNAKIVESYGFNQNIDGVPICQKNFPNLYKNFNLYDGGITDVSKMFSNEQAYILGIKKEGLQYFQEQIDEVNNQINKIIQLKRNNSSMSDFSKENKQLSELIWKRKDIHVTIQQTYLFSLNILNGVVSARLYEWME